MSESNDNILTTDSLPVLPLRDIVVFPHMIVPLFVGRDKSIRALEEAMAADKNILLVAQKDAQIDDPEPDEINTVGTHSSILQMLRLPDGTVKVLVEGQKRVRLVQYSVMDDYLSATFEDIDTPIPLSAELEAMTRFEQEGVSVIDRF